MAELAKAVVEKKQVPDIIGLLYFLLRKYALLSHLELEVYEKGSFSFL
jgi:hypothetical protein